MEANFFNDNGMDLTFNKQNVFGSESVEFDPDMVVFSHLRWDFVFQRPQHLISRFAKNRRIFFVEEPHFCDTKAAYYEKLERENGIQIIVPMLPHGLSHEQIHEELRMTVDQLIEDEIIQNYTAWYYTPMALEFTRHLKPTSVVFDCMDELSAFKHAPVHLLQLEAELLRRSDVVFTGGQSLYEAKKDRHHNIHAFPSSIDGAHFRRARTETEPEDQKHIPHPRVGFFGVIDERMDIELVDKMAQLRPDWHFVMIGPVVKIDPAHLPKHSNIHYLGKKDYKELPQYLAGWDLAMLPFARNESTQFISPTKTPEYLAAGRPVVSTNIKDVVRPYGDNKLVHIADTPEEFIACGEKAMHQARTQPEWLEKVDAFLASMSWDMTFQKMSDLVRRARESQYKKMVFRKENESQLRI
jgi:UDP-galactopyranose mutase